MDTKNNGRSILRRSSVVLMHRRLSRDGTFEEFQQTLWNPPKERASIHQISTRRASISSFDRRSSLSTITKKPKDALKASLGMPYRYHQHGTEDQQQQDRSPKIPPRDPIIDSLRDSLRDLRDSLRDSTDIAMQDLDSSQCSDISEIYEDVYNTDPSDWFLDEEMEKEPMFEILERDDLLNRMRATIDSVASQLNISPSDATLVLQYFKWNTESLLRNYFDQPDYYLREAGVSDRSSPSPISIQTPDSPSPLTCLESPSPLNSPESPFPLPSTSHFPFPPPFPSLALESCKVCLEDKLANEFFALGCQHSYCRDCWRAYLQEVAATGGSDIIRTPCMFPKCGSKLTEKDFEEVALPSSLQRYMYFLLKEYSEKELHSVFCPNPSCGNAVVYRGVGRPTDVVECHCGTRFCFSCGHEKHNPVTCDRLAEWLALLQDDSSSLEFIRATSKPCFHCGTFVERISGCNHMICRRGTGGCGGEWCWMCRGDWSAHGPHTGGFYSCNKYEESEAKTIDDQAQQYIIDKNSSRFLHYYNRYFNHDVFMKDIAKQIATGELEETMTKYSSLTEADPLFFLEAAELLVECRRVLKYTYVYGFYMQEGPSKTLFEYQQASAEGITERLSELFHTPVEIIAKSPLEFVNYVRVTKKFINNLVKSIEEGFTTITEPENEMNFPN